MSEQNLSSKRNALRFQVQGYRLRFKTEFEDGEANLVNISKGGCALSELTRKVVLQEKILLLLTLPEDEIVEAAGIIIRIVGDTCAVKFSKIGDEVQQKIVIYFAKRQRQNDNP